MGICSLPPSRELDKHEHARTYNRISKTITLKKENANTQNKGTVQGIHIVAKPIGPVCNLNCEYCFYIEKQALFGPDEMYRMSDDVLSAFIINCGATLSLRRIQDIFFPYSEIFACYDSVAWKWYPCIIYNGCSKGPAGNKAK